MKNIFLITSILLLSLAFLTPQQTLASRYFSDLANYDLADELDALVDKGALSRRDRFFPSDFLTRAELSKIAVNFAGLNTNFSGTLPFSDLPTTSAFHPFVLALYTNQMIQGYPDGSFKPNRPVTRVEAAKIILNALNYPLRETCCTFTADVSRNDWFGLYTETLLQDGLLGGVAPNRFGVNDFITRGDALRIAINADARMQGALEPTMAYTPAVSGADIQFAFYPAVLTSTSSNTPNVILGEFSLENTGEVAIITRIGFEVFINNRNNDARALNLRNVRIVDMFDHHVVGPADGRNVNGIMRLDMDGAYELLKTFVEPRFKVIADIGAVGNEGDTIRIAFNPRDKNDFKAHTKVGRYDIENIEPNLELSSPALAFGAEESQVDIPVQSFTAQTVPGNASPVLGIVLSAPTYQGIIVTRLSFDIEQGDPLGLLNTYLYDENGRLLDADIVRGTSRKIIFDSIQPHIRMERGAQKKVILGVQFSSSATPGDTYVFSFTPNAENVAAEDFEGDNIRISGPSINSGPMAPIQFTVAESGTITTEDIGPEVVDARQSLAGSDMMDVLKIRLNADVEDIAIERVAISLGGDEQDDQVAGMELYVGSTRVGDFRMINTNGNLPGFSSWDFSGSSRPIVPRDGSLQLIVKAKFNITVNSLAESGEATTFLLSDLELEGRNADIIPSLGSSKGTVTITSAGATATTNTLTVNSTAGLKVGDYLTSTTVDPNKRNQEVMTVLAINSPTSISVLRGAHQTVSNSADVQTGQIFNVKSGLVSDPFILYDTLLVVTPEGSIYGERGAPTSGQKVLQFKVAASDNPRDPRNQESTLKYLVLTVVGNSIATNFRLIDFASSNIILNGVGAHLGSGQSRIIFDLAKASSTKIRISEGSSRTYYIEADLQSVVGDSSLSVYIKTLGNKNSTFASNPSDLIWTDGTSPAIFWIDQPQNRVQPPPLTFNSSGGGVTFPPDNPTTAFVTNGGVGGTTPNLIDSFNQSNVSVDVTLPAQTTNFLGSGRDAALPGTVEVILTDANLNSTSSTAPACNNSASSCLVTVSNISAFSLINGAIRVEARTITANKGSGVFLGTQATKQ